VTASASPTTVPELLEAAAERFPDREALVDAQSRLTFRALLGAARTAARAYVAAGVQPGDRVAIWAPNRAEWVLALLGAHLAGAAVVPINTRFKGAEAAHVLGRSRATVLVITGPFLGVDYQGLLAPHRSRLPSLERVIILGDAGVEGWGAFLEGSERVAEAEVRARAAAVGAEDMSDLLFTSGTTGEPKAVVASHGQTVRAYDDWSRLAGLREGDRYLVVNPFFHSFGYKAGILACLLRGATIIPHAVFDPMTVIETVEEEAVSVLPGPPALFQSMLSRLGGHPLSATLRLAVTGAANVPTDLIFRMRDELGFADVLTGYGLTEATGVVSCCRIGDSIDTVSRTCGAPLPEVEVKVVDDKDAELPRGEAGELLVRGYTVMRGYFEDPERTAEVITADGWLRTGDIAVIRDDGYITITDRKKDLFIVGGFNAYPAEIENAMSGLPGVAQVAVIGVPDERLGEVGVAFVVPAWEATIDEASIVSWCRENLANYKVPRAVYLSESLPMNASGKVLKHELREQLVRQRST
jgi:acyl-CoA synthetase (AMP-forming)/AMP-acid ligase II